MNQKSIKSIRNQAAKSYGLPKGSPELKRLVQNLKKEYLATPCPKRCQFKKSAI